VIVGDHDQMQLEFAQLGDARQVRSYRLPLAIIESNGCPGGVARPTGGVDGDRLGNSADGLIRLGVDAAPASTGKPRSVRGPSEQSNHAQSVEGVIGAATAGRKDCRDRALVKRPL